MLDVMPAVELNSETLGPIRTQSVEMVAAMTVPMPDFPDVEVTERQVPGPAGPPDVRVLVYIPTAVGRPLSVPALLWIHRGSYVPGSADGENLQVKKIVSEVRRAALAVDYRLAKWREYMLELRVLGHALSVRIASTYLQPKTNNA